MRERGTVLSWMDSERHGTIQGKNGDVLWAHFSQIVRDAGYRALVSPEKEAAGWNDSRFC